MDIYLGTHVADYYSIGIVNPTHTDQTISAILYQRGLLKAGMSAVALIVGLA
jgi:hypothetical protein